MEVFYTTLIIGDEYPWVFLIKKNDDFIILLKFT